VRQEVDLRDPRTKEEAHEVAYVCNNYGLNLKTLSEELESCHLGDGASILGSDTRQLHEDWRGKVLRALDVLVDHEGIDQLRELGAEATRVVETLLEGINPDETLGHFTPATGSDDIATVQRRWFEAKHAAARAAAGRVNALAQRGFKEGRRLSAWTAPPPSQDELERLFRLAYREKRSTEFEDWFCNLMSLRYEDFERVKPQGRIGDQGCDGRRVDARTLFACYAPYKNEGPRWEAKIEGDFAEAKKHWSTGAWTMRTWIFVHGEDQGLFPTVAKALDTLRDQNPDLNLIPWSLDQLLLVFRELEPEEQALAVRA